MTISEKANDFTVPLSEVSMKDIARVGGKNASLGEMLQSLPQSIRVPNGFAVTADAYRHFIAANNLEPKLRAALQDLNEKDIAALSRAGAECRRIIMTGRLPDDLIDAILGAYRVLCHEYAPNTDVAVRSSATAEDLPTASFAGQQGSFVNQ
jgi:pyruvate,water dikinase